MASPLRQTSHSAMHRGFLPLSFFVAVGATFFHCPLEHLNKSHPTIQFELETPGEDGFLPILDIKVKIKADGSIERKLYTKEANKGITLHFNSHHSSSVKTTTVLNELAIAERCSTPEHREEVITSTLAKMEDDGYSSSWYCKVTNFRTVFIFVHFILLKKYEI